MFITIFGSDQVNSGKKTEINKQSHVKFWFNRKKIWSSLMFIKLYQITKMFTYVTLEWFTGLICNYHLIIFIIMYVCNLLNTFLNSILEWALCVLVCTSYIESESDFSFLCETPAILHLTRPINWQNAFRFCIAAWNSRRFDV